MSGNKKDFSLSKEVQFMLKSTRRIFLFQLWKPLSKISKYKVAAVPDILPSCDLQTSDWGGRSCCCMMREGG